MARKDESLGPNMTVVLFTGFLTFLVGTMLALASLVSQPVLSVIRAPNPDSLMPGEVVYIRGADSGRTAWRGKEQAWKQNQVDRLILTESELNQWSKERLSEDDKKEESDEASSGLKEKLAIKVDPVNFRILEDQVQLGTLVQLPGLFSNTRFQYQVFGRFQAAPDGVVFVPERGILGRAPVGSIPFAGDWLFNFLRKQYTGLDAAEWVAESLEETDSIGVSEGRLVLQRKRSS